MDQACPGTKKTDASLPFTRTICYFIFKPVIDAVRQALYRIPLLFFTTTPLLPIKSYKSSPVSVAALQNPVATITTCY